MREALDNIGQRLSAEQETRTTTVQTLGHELGRQLSDQGQQITSELARRFDELSASLERQAGALRHEKTDRATLAALLTEMAQRLHGGGQERSPMAERPVAHPPGDAPPHAGQASADELAQLRQLLIGPERRDIDQVKQDIERLGRVDAEDVAPVLPQAVLQSSRTGRQIAEAMLPVVEEDIGLSVKRHPRDSPSCCSP